MKQGDGVRGRQSLEEYYAIRCLDCWIAFKVSVSPDEWVQRRLRDRVRTARCFLCGEQTLDFSVIHEDDHHERG